MQEKREYGNATGHVPLTTTAKVKVRWTFKEIIFQFLQKKNISKWINIVLSFVLFQPKKLGFTQFSHLRKRKPDESADYICPMDSEALTVNGVSRLLSTIHRGFSSTLDRQVEKWQPAAVKAQSNVPNNSWINKKKKLHSILMTLNDSKFTETILWIYNRMYSCWDLLDGLRRHYEYM